MKEPQPYRLVRLTNKVPKEMVIEAWNMRRGPYGERLHQKYRSLEEAIKEEAE